MDERAFIARVEAADAEELIKILQRPTADEERALRVHFGDVRYERMRSRAVKASTTRGTGKASQGQRGGPARDHGRRTYGQRARHAPSTSG